MGEIILVRHGETEWSATHRHTSTTDLPLTPRGEAQARALADGLADIDVAAVVVSPRRRARRTAELAGLSVTLIDPDLVEWDYGEYEGLTTAQIRQTRPEWFLWRDGCRGGESPGQVAARADRVLERVGPLVAGGGTVALVAHGHLLRVITARWLGLEPAAGALFRLDVATLSVLGYEREQRVIQRWNAPLPQ